MGWIKGKKFSIEHKKNIAKSLKTKILSEESKKKISKSIKKCYISGQLKAYWKGKKLTEETKKKMSEAKKGKKFSDNHKLHLSESLTGRVLSDLHRENIRKRKIGKKPSEKTRKLLAIKTIEYKQKTGQWLSIGRNEKQILDNQEKLIGYKIQRQVPIIGYIVDGYCPELNTVYEVYEKGHKRQRSLNRDIKREKEIREHLNCNFKIIWDI
jgi:hypothetical protein